MNHRKEESLQLAVCNYLRAQYPTIPFLCDLAAGMRLTIGQAVKAQKMRSNRGMPDIYIFASRRGKSGLMLELKREGTKLFLKDGFTFRADPHVKEQKEAMDRIWAQGYECYFAVGFDSARKLIDDYLDGTPPDKLKNLIFML